MSQQKKIISNKLLFATYWVYIYTLYVANKNPNGSLIEDLFGANSIDGFRDDEVLNFILFTSVAHTKFNPKINCNGMRQISSSFQLLQFLLGQFSLLKQLMSQVRVSLPWLVTS